MAGATVIDQLIVKLGLDPSDFSKGQKKVAEGMISTEQTVKKSSDSMGRSLLGFTGKMLGVATAAVALKKAVSYVSDLSVSVRQLGIDSRNFRMAANEMRNFQNIGEMMGGKAEDVTKTIGGITKAVYDLAYNGQISDSLIMLGRLGVQFQDTAGNARDFKSIVLDTETAIQSSMKSGKTTYANANQMLLQAGFDPGLARAMLEGTVSKQLAQQGARRQVDGEAVSSATKWEQSATNRDQAIEAATLRALPNAAKAGAFGNDKLAAGAEKLSDATLAGTLDGIGSALSTAGEKIKNGTDKLVDSLENLGARAWRNVFPTGRQAYEGTIQTAAAKHGINPEMLAGILNTESNFDPSKVNPKSGAIGVAQLMPKYFPDAGKSPYQDINTSAAFVRALQDNFERQGYTGAERDKLVLQSYNAGQSRVQKSMRPGGKPLKQETLDYPDKVLGYAASAIPTPGAQNNGGNTTNRTEVNIGKVDVNTQATNADGIASDFADATRRKMNAAQADRGMN